MEREGGREKKKQNKEICPLISFSPHMPAAGGAESSRGRQLGIQSSLLSKWQTQLSESHLLPPRAGIHRKVESKNRAVT